MNRKKSNRISLFSSNEAGYRRATRVMRMVLELHKLGYQGLRIVTGISGSGFYWRCAVTYASNIDENYNYTGKGNYKFNKFLNNKLVARYSSAQDNRYFGWKDASEDNARQLAVKFKKRFPEILTRSKFKDHKYTGWLAETIGYAEKEDFPIFYDSNEQSYVGGSVTYFSAGLPPKQKIIIKKLMNENDVVQAVSEYLIQQGFKVKSATTQQTGIDIQGIKSNEQWIIEAKGETSSEKSSKRYGKIMTKSQHYSQVSTCMFKIMQELKKSSSNKKTNLGMAFPKNKIFLELVDSIYPSIKKVGIKVLWVNKDSTIEIKK